MKNKRKAKKRKKKKLKFIDFFLTRVMLAKIEHVYIHTYSTPKAFIFPFI